MEIHPVKYTVRAVVQHQMIMKMMKHQEEVPIPTIKQNLK